MSCATHLPLAVFGMGPTELIVIFGIVILLFGATKLPSLARGLGQSIKEFKKASNADAEDDKTTASADTTKQVEPATTKTHGAN